MLVQGLRATCLSDETMFASLRLDIKLQSRTAVWLCELPELRVVQLAIPELVAKLYRVSLSSKAACICKLS